jgi:hypothetical protein
MKKIILGLGLCFGLSQVAVAVDEVSFNLSEDESQGVVSWIKNNPKKFAALVASASALGYLTYKIYQAEAGQTGEGEAAVSAGWRGKVQNGLYDATAPLTSAGQSVANAAVYARDGVGGNMKAHKKWWIGIPSAVSVVVLAAVIANYTEMDKVAKDQFVALWNKFFGSDDKPVEPVDA